MGCVGEGGLKLRRASLSLPKRSNPADIRMSSCRLTPLRGSDSRPAAKGARERTRVGVVQTLRDLNDRHCGIGQELTRYFITDLVTQRFECELKGLQSAVQGTPMHAQLGSNRLHRTGARQKLSMHDTPHLCDKVAGFASFQRAYLGFENLNLRGIGGG